MDFVAFIALFALVVYVAVGLFMRFVPWKVQPQVLFWFALGCAVLSWTNYWMHVKRGDGFGGWLIPVALTAIAVSSFINWRREWV
jgi:hypothetical protein